MAASFDLTGRRALITGSSRGIGHALARGLLDAGAEVVLNARDDAQLQRQLAAIAPGRVSRSAFDVTDEQNVQAAAAAIGPVDILVNNAGIQRRAPLTEFATTDFDDIMATNVRSAFLVTRDFAPAMIRRGSGKIVMICSVQSMLARPGIAAYSASKGALAMFVKGACSDLAPHGIQVNALAPGYFATELTSELVDDAKFTAWVQRRTPAGRWGAVDDLIGPLVWLSSSASDFVNGQTIYVDGGMTSVL